MNYLRAVAVVWMLLTAACSPDTSDKSEAPAASPETTPTATLAAAPMQLVPCSADWYAEIEAALGTVDGQGHGPDPGSDEWQSAIEYKLGLLSDPAVPARTSEQWCSYIDQVWLASHQ